MSANNNIVTERLIIRNVNQDDASDIWNIWKNPENEKYMSDPVKSINEVTFICKDKENIINFDKGLLRVAVLKSNNEIIGTCCFGSTNKDTEWGFGYSIKPEYWKQGYATELVQGIIDFGIQCGIHDFKTSCANENNASAKVLQKCGMKFDHKSSFIQPILNVEYEDDVYSLHIN